MMNGVVKKLMVIPLMAATGAGGSPTVPAAPEAPKQHVTANEPSIHAPFDRLLRKHVRDGHVDYAAFKKKEAVLDAYLATLADTSPAGFPTYDRMALWINAYNAFTIKLILRHYPGIRSIKDIPRRWDREEWTVAGQRYSLGGIEHEILRKEFNDPRIHFAIVCASKSCPSLASASYEGDRLDEQLTRAARGFLADRDKGFRAFSKAGLLYGTNHYVYLSKIFDWFEEDFEKHGGSMLNAILPYLSPRDRAFIDGHRDAPKLRYLSYDWSLNGG